MKLNYQILLFTLLIPFTGFAQPDNDFCLDAIPISNVTKFCSKSNEFTNVGATFDTLLGDFGKPDCWNNAKSDVWFRFIAIATDVQITVKGSALKQPQIALYAGSCNGTIATLGCEGSANNSNATTLYRGGLTIGGVYRIRINSSTTQNGTFQLCVNNYDPPKTQNGDCGSGTVLCNKDPFHVLSVTGFGFIRDEADNSCLDLDNSDPLNNQSETNSTWFKWTAKTSGTLGFVITPEIIDDDMDFAVYEMTSINDCNGKKLLRCVATGCQTTLSNSTCLSRGCLGPTGLRDGDGDIGENYNCDPGENGFARSLDMVAGKSYALIINNYSNAGNGFFMEFTGTAEFQGPTANFSVDPPSGLKCSQPFTITDSSFFGNGNISKYTWNFGEGALPTEIGTGKGPFNINYKSYGTKTIVLVVESNLGCSEVLTRTIDVQPCCEDLPTLKINPNAMNLVCNGIPDGSVNISGNGGTPEYLFSFNNSKFKRQFAYKNLDIGSYLLKITDAKGCRDSTVVTLNEPPPITADAGPDLTGRLGYEVTLKGSYNSGQVIKSVRWIPPDGVVCDTCLMTDAIPPGSTKYILEITTVNGCKAYDSMFVDVSIDRALYIPNVFTPERDGRNKIFKFYGNRAISGINYLRVFNRWGGLVFEGIGLDINDDLSGWDGTSNGQPLPSGVYTFMASVQFVDRVDRIIKGDVTLLR